MLVYQRADHFPETMAETMAFPLGLSFKIETMIASSTGGLRNEMMLFL
jgi:hypothetical protein